jgi:hypothetical protein
VHTADLAGLPVPCWLPGGDLLVGTWLGQVQRLGADYQTVWSALVRSTAPDMRTDFLAAATAPIASVTDHGNGIAPLSGPNLYPAGTIISFEPAIAGQGLPVFAAPNPVPAGYAPTPPAAPWLFDRVVESFASSAANTEPYIIRFRFPVDPKTGQATVRFTAISLWDDPAHPESWLRDLRLDVRDSPDYAWRPVSRLISDQAARSYLVTDPAHPGRPVSAAEFRLVLPPGLAGNLRLAAIALHLTAD